MDRHSFLSCLPFLVPVQGGNWEEADDPFLADPSHVVLRNHDLSVEVESHGVALFDATGVSSDTDPGLTPCLVYLEGSKLCLKIAGRLYFVDWSQIREVVLGCGNSSDSTTRPPFILLRFDCCSFRIFSLQPDKEGIIEKQQSLGSQLRSLLSSNTAHPDLPIHSDSLTRTSSSGTSSNAASCVSPGSHNQVQAQVSPNRKRCAAHASHQGMRSLITALDIPSSDGSPLQARDVFNLLNTIADDMNASYATKETDGGNVDGYPATGVKRACPEHAWVEYFPAPRAKSTVSSISAKEKEQIIHATKEWMDEQKRLTRERHEALLSPMRG